ncbi:MAG: hypothetical protein KDD78_19185 [Caldilineaceae bacterium]|nr:hypothetical protein [Caldilineaceae bacterium]
MDIHTHPTMPIPHKILKSHHSTECKGINVYTTAETRDPTDPTTASDQVFAAPTPDLDTLHGASGHHRLHGDDHDRHLGRGHASNGDEDGIVFDATTWTPGDGGYLMGLSENRPRARLSAAVSAPLRRGGQQTITGVVRPSLSLSDCETCCLKNRSG